MLDRAKYRPCLALKKYHFSPFFGRISFGSRPAYADAKQAADVLIDMEILSRDSGASFAVGELPLRTLGVDGTIVAFRHFFEFLEYGAKAHVR